jgi:hypothetical protein
MNIRVVMIAISAASMAAAAAAQPGKDEPKNSKPAAAQTPVILASASNVRRPSPTDANRPTEPARRPAPRVTTCRCGDPQPEQDQQQPDE